MDTVDVSFVVPARNEATTLPRTLDSIQTLDTDYEYEALVVDGASSDGTGAVAQANGATVIAGNGDGIAAGRNRGARRATGEWLASSMPIHGWKRTT